MNALHSRHFISMVVACVLTTLCAQDAPQVHILPGVDVTSSVQRGVDYLLTLADDNPRKSFFPPLTSRRIVDWKTTTVRYRLVEKDMPVHIYETVETILPPLSGSETPRKVTTRRIVGVKAGESRKQTFEKIDPQGSLTKEIKSPVYEKADSNDWGYGTLGMNAAAIVALLLCGVDPAEPVLEENARMLREFVGTAGPPDHLVDLAWMTVAFSLLPGDEYEAVARECAAKLLDAQIQEGPAKGLWGPIAVNTAQLAFASRLLFRMADELEVLRTEIRQEQTGSTRDSSMKLRRLEEKEQAFSEQFSTLRAKLARISPLGIHMLRSMGPDFKGLVDVGTTDDKIQVIGLPYLAHNQRTADVESTALAAFALRVAHEARRLPAETTRIATGDPRAPFPAPLMARQVIPAAYQRLLQERQADGRWHELNLQEPLRDFAGIGSIPSPDPKAFGPMNSPRTPFSVARGAGAVMNFALILQGPDAQVRAIQYPVLQADLTSALQSQDPAVVSEFMTLLPLLSRLRPDRSPTPAGPFWDEIAASLLSRQTPSGAWGAPKRTRILVPSSLQARMRDLPPLTSANIHEFLDKPHLSPSLFFSPHVQAHYSVPEHGFATIMALIFLSDALPATWTPTPRDSASPDESTPENVDTP